MPTKVLSNCGKGGTKEGKGCPLGKGEIYFVDKESTSFKGRGIPSGGEKVP